MKRLAFALLAGTCLPALAAAQEVPALMQPTASATSQATRDAATAQATATAAPADPQAGQTGAAMTVPKTMPPMIRLNSPDKPLSRRASVGVSVATQWRNRFTKPSVGPDGVMRFTYGVGEPAVVCAVAHICDIALQPGEQVTGPPHIGDRDRWWLHPAVSGSGRTRTTHLIIKPIDAGLDTNVVVETDRRTYSIQLISTLNRYMPMVAFNYPGDTQAAEWASLSVQQAGGGTSPCDQPPSIPPSSYRITVKDGNPRWAPVQAYAVATAVGTKTCIDFPSDIGSASLPALVALGNDGGWFSEPSKIIVNFRYVKRRFVVDDLLDRAELVNGIDGNRELVKITRIEGR